MKYLSDIIKQDLNDLNEKYHAFFAFSEKQLKDGLKGRSRDEYCSLGGGLCVPLEFAESYVKDYAAIVNNGVKKDVELHGIENVILRELSNYECFYTYELDDAYDALEDYEEYGATEELIKKVFHANKHKFD